MGAGLFIDPWFGNLQACGDFSRREYAFGAEDGAYIEKVKHQIGDVGSFRCDGGRTHQHRIAAHDNKTSLLYDMIRAKMLKLSVLGPFDVV